MGITSPAHDTIPDSILIKNRARILQEEKMCADGLFFWQNVVT